MIRQASPEHMGTRPIFSGGLCIRNFPPFFLMCLNSGYFICLIKSREDHLSQEGLGPSYLVLAELDTGGIVEVSSLLPLAHRCEVVGSVNFV